VNGRLPHFLWLIRKRRFGISLRTQARKAAQVLSVGKLNLLISSELEDCRLEARSLAPYSGQTKPIARGSCCGVIQYIFRSLGLLRSRFLSAYASCRPAADLRMLCILLHFHLRHSNSKQLTKLMEGRHLR
jgi:hypothetical protein